MLIKSLLISMEICLRFYCMYIPEKICVVLNDLVYDVNDQFAHSWLLMLDTVLHTHSPYVQLTTVFFRGKFRKIKECGNVCPWL